MRGECVVPRAAATGGSGINRRGQRYGVDPELSYGEGPDRLVPVPASALCVVTARSDRLRTSFRSTRSHHSLSIHTITVHKSLVYGCDGTQLLLRLQFGVLQCTLGRPSCVCTRV